MKTQIAAMGLAAIAMTGCTVQLGNEPAQQDSVETPTPRSAAPVETKSSTEQHYDYILEGAWAQQDSYDRSTFCSGFNEYPYVAALTIVGDGTDFPGLTTDQVVEFFNKKCGPYS